MEFEKYGTLARQSTSSMVAMTVSVSSGLVFGWLSSGRISL
jgi:hypothetical protein